MTEVLTRAVGAPIDRLDGRPKVTGEARYAAEYPIDNIAFVCPVQATIAAGRVTAVDATAALTVGCVLAVLTHENALRMTPLEPGPMDAEIGVLQSDEVSYRGQLIAAVVATSWESAREAAELITVEYERRPHEVELRADSDELFKPERVNAGNETDSRRGQVEPALAAAAVTVDETYTTPACHNNPLEPHATIAVWQGEELTVYDSNQGPHIIRTQLAKAFGLPAENVRVVSPYVGGGFGSKVLPHPHLALAVMSAKVCGRPVKLALTRQQMFAIVGYRTPTIQRLRLGADDSGRLTALSHDAVAQTSLHHQFGEQSAVASRFMYAAPNIATTHRFARLNVPFPTFMRAPGECPGMFALESAIDELALACGHDPVEFRIRNLPTTDVAAGLPFSSHGVAECLREGARRFAWAGRAARRRDGRWLIGSGVALGTYPARQARASALIRAKPDGSFDVLIGASDIGNGSTTVLAQIAADALRQPVERVHVRLGDSDLPIANSAGGSMGTSTWGTAIVDAATNLLAQLDEVPGGVPARGIEASGSAGRNPAAEHYSMHSFGAQFAEVRVDPRTGEVRVPRLHGMFACGRIMNPKLARSQLVGGMTMGLSMALHEESVLDPVYGDYLNHDFAGFHIAVNADVDEIEANWIDEDDPHLNPMGLKGIGEIGIVGTAAAIANAVADATGVRIRDLPIRPDRLLARR